MEGAEPNTHTHIPYSFHKQVLRNLERRERAYTLNKHMFRVIVHCEGEKEDRRKAAHTHTHSFETCSISRVIIHCEGEREGGRQHTRTSFNNDNFLFT